MSFFGLGGGGIKIQVLLDGNINNNIQQQQQNRAVVEQKKIVPMHHMPSWKLRKNPFWKISVSSSNSLPTNEAGLPILHAYEASQDIGGKIVFLLPSGKKTDHLGIKIQFIGRIDMGHGIHEGRPHYDFISLTKELLPPGSIYQAVTEIPFMFKHVEKEHESYMGRNVNVRYFVKVMIERKFLPPITSETDVWVQSYGQPPPQNEAIKMEVGIEECLHIEFEYERRAYHLKDTITGNIHFLLIRIKIKYMELAVIRREISGDGVAAIAEDANNKSNNSSLPPSGNNIFTETQTLIKYGIMDGCPFAKDVIPVRLSLEGIPADLTPTYTSVNQRFSVRYYLNLVLVDEEDRRYFKQQEIILWRKELG
eukprot:CAMPEP_0194182592 /NCGR_PEP_ID=MMETSP0154-20130528/25540_1 /TAXON_ID=1049557 /ORGANISM="Thalassiothrix antarctica, Strain L6-D1" /LENGTH=365 /DNA_ID=CAMNT_0038898969 /DNA_START=98 /DNA_END=1191 /DNA_ORIENTATION=-